MDFCSPMLSTRGKQATNIRTRWSLSVACLVLAAASAAARDDAQFLIRVIDEETRRGVPLVELTTVGDVRYYTDSNGIVAFHEPGLMNQKVFFHVKSHGYEFRKDGFGYRGRALEVVPGGSATLGIKRLNIAERLYRVTGGGIYRDSVLVGEPVPIKQPTLNGKVVGSDSVVSAVYRGKIHWFWGDTNRPRYPLGNFDVSGATSVLPGQGGLDPGRGVDLRYFVGEEKFARKMGVLISRRDLVRGGGHAPRALALGAQGRHAREVQLLQPEAAPRVSEGRGPHHLFRGNVLDLPRRNQGGDAAVQLQSDHVPAGSLEQAPRFARVCCSRLIHGRQDHSSWKRQGVLGAT